jgi:expansin (peptidoglycan-binding protein)
LRGAVLRTSTDGAALWSQRSSQVEITALMACTVAAGGVPAQMAHASGVVVDLDDY